MGIPALKKCLVCQLRHSIQGFSPNRAVTEIEIPLHRLRDRFPLIYQSAIAHRLAALLNQSAITIATRLVTQIQSESTESVMFHNKRNCKVSQPDFTLQVIPSGMIQVELTDVGMAHWLQQMTQISPTETETQPDVIFPDALFPIQYSHARCCSMLRRAHQDHLITLISLDSLTPSSPWQFCDPNPIPWLTPQQQLQLNHPAEQVLMAQLITMVDHNQDQSRELKWQRLAHDLSQAFQQFYSQCQIWGDVKQNNLKLAQARLGLVFVTQFVLQLILQEKLRVIAPLEL